MEIREAFVEFGLELPMRWLMGDSELEIDVDLLREGQFDIDTRVVKGLSGRAWLRIPCARPRVLRPERLVDRVETSRFVQALEVVDDVVHPETQISLASARSLRPDVKTGESIAIVFDADRRDLKSILDLGRGLGGVLDAETRAARFLVEFDDLTVDLGDTHLGRVIEGIAKYVDKIRRTVEIVIDGFTLVLSGLTLDITRTVANAAVRLPSGVMDAASCGSAVIDLGTIRLSPTCDYFFEEPDRPFGPWLLGDTGMIVEGTGFVLDLSKTRSSAPWPTTRRGLLLHTGTASGAQHIPDPCNSGYLRGDYRFVDAVVVASGFAGQLELAAPVRFTAINPFGQVFSFSKAVLQVDHSEITMGELYEGSTELVAEAVCDGLAGTPVTVPLPLVTVHPDLDLTADVLLGGRSVSWGELTRSGEEVVVWTAHPDEGYLYLPGGAVATFSPVRSGGFSSLNVAPGWSASLPSLESNGVAGVTFADLGDVAIFSPDVPGGTAQPLNLDRVSGWLRVGATGVDGTLVPSLHPVRAELGDPIADGYVGNGPFDALFAFDRRDVIAEFVTSAAYDSHVSGTLEIPSPCQFATLPFGHLKLTSTACIVGGDIFLPSAGLPLEHWDVNIVPTSPTTPAGVLSVRTGRVLFTAASIAEPAHFARPFGLTWGEILADGSLGELYLNFNDWGQRFDGLVFHPAEITLSAYDPNNATPYLGVSGEVVFPFFGVHHINVNDAAKRTTPPSPPYPRYVTVQESAITPHSAPTDLALTGVWHDVSSAVLAHFDCLDVDVKYNEQLQEGFIGTGSAMLSILQYEPLDTTIEIHSDATDIRFTSIQSHDLDLNVIARFGALSQIAGNLRIEGPTLRSMTVYGMFERSAAVGIFGPKAGFEVEANMTITPTSFDFYASGDMMLSLALVEVEASGTAHLLFDFARGTAEGEFLGRVDCDDALAGLSGEGQLTWFLGPQMQYLQGRLKVEMFDRGGGASLEGGFFIGNDVPNNLAWALDTTDPKFGMSRALLPSTITGIYGYGRRSFAVNYYILGGGIDIFVGAGAFSAGLTSGGPLSILAGNPPLPYVVGACGVNAHGEILGGLVSASAWANLSMRGPLPPSFEGTFELEGCVAWVFCSSVDVTARVSSSGFELV